MSIGYNLAFSLQSMNTPVGDRVWNIGDVKFGNHVYDSVNLTVSSITSYIGMPNEIFRDFFQTLKENSTAPIEIVDDIYVFFTDTLCEDLKQKHFITVNLTLVSP